MTCSSPPVLHWPRPFLLTFATLACQPDDPAAAGAGFQVRDSAGIRIVENASPPPGSRLDWRIGPAPSASIGVREGEEPYMLHNAFDADGRFGRVFSLARDADRFPSAAAVRTDGAILARAYAGRSDAVVEIRNGDGSPAISLGTFPATEVYEYERPEGGRGTRHVAYGFVLVTGFWGDLVFFGLTNRYEIRALGADGTLVRIVRRDHAPRATTQADVDHYVESQLSYYPDFSPDEVARYREVFESTPLAETFPAFSGVLSDAAGNLWVREYDFPGEPRPAPLWTVFDSGGRVLGLVETPDGLGILEIGEDYILGRTEDDLGVESVHVWPLERSDEV